MKQMDKSTFDVNNLNLKDASIKKCIQQWMDIWFDMRDGLIDELSEGLRKYLKENIDFVTDFTVDLSDILFEEQRELFPEFCSEGTIYEITEQYINNLTKKFEDRAYGEFKDWLNRDND